MITCTGATGLLVTRAMVAPPGGDRAADRWLVVDLALPHDVEPGGRPSCPA